MTPRLFLLPVLLLLWPFSAQAQKMLGPEEFRAYAEGQTLYFSFLGAPYGVEQYLPGNRAIWQYADGTCARGIWYGRDGLICFLYEGDGEEQCWQFLQDGDGYAARAVGMASPGDLRVVGRDRVPVICKAPDVGA